MVELKKADIIKGIDKVEKHKIEALKGEIWLRPLSQSEISEVQEIEASGFGKFKTEEKARRGARQTKAASEMKSFGELNVKETQKASNEAKTKAVYYSLENEKYADDPFTLTDISNLTGKAFNEIYEVVQEISGLSEDVDLEDEVDSFPEN